MVDDAQVTSTEDEKDKTMGTNTSVDAVMKCMKRTRYRKTTSARSAT